MLEQTSDAEDRQMWLELEAWLRASNESAADSLLGDFEEWLSRHRLKVQAWRRKTLLSTILIERLCSLARHRERTAHAHAGAR